MIAIIGMAFYVGYLHGQQEGGAGVILSCSPDVLSELKIPLEESSSIIPVVQAESGQYAGSKNGTKYYTPGCAGLNRIKPENIIWFQNKEDATLQGYTPANC